MRLGVQSDSSALRAQSPHYARGCVTDAKNQCVLECGAIAPRRARGRRTTLAAGRGACLLRGQTSHRTLELK
jgi:hypothetical protein